MFVSMFVGLLARTAWANSPTHNPGGISVAQGSETSIVQVDWPTYTGTAFTIQYPQGSSVNALNEDTIEIVSPEASPAASTTGNPTGNSTGTPNMSIHTQVQLLRENPEAVVNQGIDGFISEQARVGRYSLVTVNNQSGFRIWLSERSGERTHAVVTYIGYGDAQTVVLTSEYSPDVPDAEATIAQIHDSFTSSGF
jgi:hypothetical protein